MRSYEALVSRHPGPLALPRSPFALSLYSGTSAFVPGMFMAGKSSDFDVEIG